MRKLLTYRRTQYKNLRKELEHRGYSIFSATEFQPDESISALKYLDAVAIDVSTYIELFDASAPLASMIELLLFQTPDDTLFLADEAILSKGEYQLRTLFETSEPSDVDDELSIVAEALKAKRTIDSLDNGELKKLFSYLDTELIGQSFFKTEFRKQIKAFRIFHAIGDQPILSIFITGSSGVGKTEVARILAQSLAPKEPLPKVNFGNYSSKDALNSLIGSPRGYMGSETGELNMRVEGSQAGILLIDEFEKADNAVWNFFLELLETGNYTDAQGEQHSLDGYIIVFTSNTPRANVATTYPAELLSRFNIKASFNPLSTLEKEKFVHRYIDRIAEKLKKEDYFETDSASETFVSTVAANVDCVSTDNIRVLRDIARKRISETLK